MVDVPPRVGTRGVASEREGLTTIRQQTRALQTVVCMGIPNTAWEMLRYGWRALRLRVGSPPPSRLGENRSGASRPGCHRRKYVFANGLARSVASRAKERAAATASRRGSGDCANRATNHFDRAKRCGAVPRVGELAVTRTIREAQDWDDDRARAHRRLGDVLRSSTEPARSLERVHPLADGGDRRRRDRAGEIAAGRQENISIAAYLPRPETPGPEAGVCTIRARRFEELRQRDRDAARSGPCPRKGECSGTFCAFWKPAWRRWGSMHQ